MIAVPRAGGGSSPKRQSSRTQPESEDASDDELPDLPTESGTMSQETSGMQIISLFEFVAGIIILSNLAMAPICGEILSPSR